MGQTGQVKLFKVHIATPDASASSGRLSPFPRAHAAASQSAVIARDSPNHEKNILGMIPNRLTSLWLKGAPCAYSFCNMDLHPIKSYSDWTVFLGFSAPGVHRE